MRTAGLIYSTGNIGDEIQSIAADRIVGNIDERFDREKLADYQNKESFNIVLNGWYSNKYLSSFPPSDIFNPVFFSFHIFQGRKNKAHFKKKESIAYFKKHEPIGCRDIATMKFLKKHGVDAFYSKCLTMTFPKREVTPVKEKIFFVDADFAKALLPAALSGVQQESVKHGITPEGDKIEFAEKLLDKYKNEATLVVTTRLHCALPCLAMGIPVILFHNPNDLRMSVVKSAGLKIYKDRIKYPKFLNYLLFKLNILERVKAIHRNYFINRLKVTNKIDWSPEVIDIESFKKEIIDELKGMIGKKFQV